MINAFQCLRPQGVGSAGFNSPILRWLLVVLQVGLLAISHALSVLAADRAERKDNMTNSQHQSLSNTELLVSSASTTIWTIAASVVAGALSASDIETNPGEHLHDIGSDS